MAGERARLLAGTLDDVKNWEVGYANVVAEAQTDLRRERAAFGAVESLADAARKRSEDWEAKAQSLGDGLVAARDAEAEVVAQLDRQESNLSLRLVSEESETVALRGRLA